MTSLSLTNLDPYARRLTALANKGGAALPLTKVTSKTWDATLDAALDRLESAPAPAAAPAPIPAPTMLNIAEDAARIQGLAAVDHGAGIVYVRNSVQLPAVDWTGYTLMVDGPVAVSLAGGRMSRTQQTPLIAVAWNDTDSDPLLVLSGLDIAHPQVFGPNMQAAVSVNRGSLTLTGSRIHDCAAAAIAVSAGVRTIIDGNTFGAVGKGAYFDTANPANNVHAEAVHIAGGEAFIARNRFDSSDAAQRVPQKVISAVVFIQARVSAVRARLEANDITGLEGYPLWYPISLDANRHGAAVDLVGNRLRRATFYGEPGAYLGNTGAAVTAAGNVDGQSGVNIDALLH